MKLKYALPAALAMAFLLTASAAAKENKLNRVFVVNYLTVEVEMDQPLTAEETDPTRINDPHFQPEFVFNEGIRMTGMPVLQENSYHDNTYRIPVTAMDIGYIYQISYKGQKPKTFKVYEGKEQDDRYRDRYGSYF